jgi:hypothetical protein
MVIIFRPILASATRCVYGSIPCQGIAMRVWAPAKSSFRCNRKRAIAVPEHHIKCGIVIVTIHNDKIGNAIVIEVCSRNLRRSTSHA